MAASSRASSSSTPSTCRFCSLPMEPVSYSAVLSSSSAAPESCAGSFLTAVHALWQRAVRRGVEARRRRPRSDEGDNSELFAARGRTSDDCAHGTAGTKASGIAADSHVASLRRWRAEYPIETMTMLHSERELNVFTKAAYWTAVQIFCRISCVRAGCALQIRAHSHDMRSSHTHCAGRGTVRAPGMIGCRKALIVSNLRSFPVLVLALKLIFSP